VGVAELQLKGVRKSFQSVEVIHGMDLVVKSGSFTVFVGPSGCGKSTLLRMIAGLEDVTAGEILLDGERCEHLLPSARGMAMVFQSYALYPHMSVRENLRFGLVCHKVPKAEIAERIARAADILQIAHLLERQPSQLSGGQSQRVAIGRAIVKEPKAFLFDEPLSNLDAELRVKMRSEISALHRRLGSTMIYVTHDQVEAMTMADTIVVLREGAIEQIGSPIDLYSRPRNRFVASFLGAPQMNLLAAAWVAKGDAASELILDEGRVRISAHPESAHNAALLGIRPEHLILADIGALRARVESCEILGAETIVHGTLESGERLAASLRGLKRMQVGEIVSFDLELEHIHLFDKSGEIIVA
jgi:multiple sugar transport system ATP-binding protein